MIIEEIYKELYADFRNIFPTLQYRAEKFRSLCLKTHRFPLRQSYECKSLVRRNRFFVIFTAMSAVIIRTRSRVTTASTTGLRVCTAQSCILQKTDGRRD